MGALGAGSVLVLARIDPDQPVSYAEWALSALGTSGLYIAFLGFVILIGALVVVGKSRRPAVIAAYLLFVPLPLMMAVYATLAGTVASFSVVAMSDVDLKPSEVAGGLAETGLLLMLGLLAVVPSYLVIAIGLFVRTVQAAKDAGP